MHRRSCYSSSGPSGPLGHRRDRLDTVGTVETPSGAMKDRRENVEKELNEENFTESQFTFDSQGSHASKSLEITCAYSLTTLIWRDLLNILT